jgi:hypothetical protein
MQKILTVVFFLFCFAAALFLVASRGAPALAQSNAPRDLNYQVFLPLVTNNVCGDIPGEVYGTLVPNPPPTDRPAEQHADLNLALRGYQTTSAALGLVDYDGATDPGSVRLYTLFADQRVPVFSSAARIYGWDWGTNSRGPLITDPDVTYIGIQVAANEALRVPSSGYNIGTVAQRPIEGVFKDSPTDDPNAYEVLVLYAAPTRITLKYTREDNVIHGYTLHVENVCVAPNLLALYKKWNDAGRTQLPALKAGQAFGRALSNEIGVVTRDTGAFMDPRSRKDWWAGK